MANVRAVQEGRDLFAHVGEGTLEEVRAGEDVLEDEHIAEDVLEDEHISDDALEEEHVGEDALEGDVFRDVPTPEFAERHRTPPAEIHETDTANLSIHDRILYYAMYVQHFGLSGEEIKRMEELMHVIYGSSPPITGGPTYDRSDVRYFQWFYQKIETSEEFHNNHLKVLLSVSIDGFVPKRISRREVWPLYLRVDNIRKSEADKYINSMLSGMFFSLVKPTDQMIEVLFSRIELEMKALQEVPIMINVDGNVWTLEISLHRGIADIGAQKTLFGVPRWNSHYGCSKCYIKGQHIGRHQVWIPTQEDNVSLRSPASYSADGLIGANGIPKETSVMRIITPHDFPADALHVCSGGVSKNRLRDLFNASTRFPELRINRDRIDSIKRSLKEASCHTYSNSLILSLDNLRSCKAAELDEIAFVLFPLADQGTLEINGIFTMKCHWFFDHAISKEIEMYGSAYQWSSAPFESHHRRLQIRLNQSTVNSSTLMVERYLFTAQGFP
ncbi:hypothetical protein Aduo_011511 [Ancylostoma duodenale]